jgi:2-phosphoglycerate kinase
MADFVNSGRPLIILLGGTPGSGKSTIAADIASRLNIVRTQSTDMLREVMRSIISSKVQPLLHRSSFSAWTLLSNSNSKDEAYIEALLIEGFSRQVDILSGAIEAVIQRAVRESVSLIVEGVHLHPAGTYALTDLGDALVVPVMLGVPSSKALRSRISGRSSLAPQRRATHYLEHFDSIWKLQSYLLAESDQAGVPIIINTNREHVFREVMLTTIHTLAQDFDKSADEVFG